MSVTVDLMYKIYVYNLIEIKTNRFHSNVSRTVCFLLPSDRFPHDSACIPMHVIHAHYSLGVRTQED